MLFGDLASGDMSSRDLSSGDLVINFACASGRRTYLFGKNCANPSNNAGFGAFIKSFTGFTVTFFANPRLVFDELGFA